MTSPISSARRTVWPSFVLLAVSSLMHSPSQGAPPRRGLDTSSLPEPLNRRIAYFRDVHPLLAEHCVSCHGPDKQKGGLRLDSREAALQGGEYCGPAIWPGRSEESPLIQFMGHLEVDMEMPPNEDPLPDRDIALLRAWIDQGARWPTPKHEKAGEDIAATLGNQELFFEQAESHWAYQPVPALPEFENGSVRIDELVRTRLEEEGLSPSPPANPRALLRRIHFDLTGLPPTPGTAESFLSNPSPAAYEQLVDSLLASPHFGERWARYWLDLARYADTRDWQAQKDLRYPYAWTYRDYVIDAFNEDKPYDRFLREQIAADQLDGLAEDAPELAALGFLTVGPRFRNRQVEIINDRIDVVTRGVMGMTATCARCHDHKYDPIRTEDFYALYGVFQSTQDVEELPEIDLPAAAPNPKQRAAYEKTLARKKQDLTEFVQGLKDEAIEDILAKPVLYLDALHQLEVAKSSNVRKLITGKKMVETALTPLARAWQDFRRSARFQKDPVIGPMARVAAAKGPQKARFLAQMTRTGKVPGSGVAIHPVVLRELRAAKPEDEKELLALYGRVLAEAQKKPGQPPNRSLLAAFTGEGGWLDFDLQVVENAHRLLGKGRRKLNEFHTAISEVDATHPGAPPRAMAVQNRPRAVTPVVFVRGDPGNRGDRVPRRFFEVLDPSKQPFREGSGRKELAERITGRDNPLTGRVWANHVWRHLFGEGLVDTPGDFGLQADPPSNPELLDFLAAALMDRGWSTKQLIRDIVLSDTYRQSSRDRPEASAVDPENELFWRANRRRMDFEGMRDAMLATSGQIDLKLGGRPVDLSEEPFSTRRTVYGHVDRVNLDPLFTTFDFPSPDVSSPERPSTMVPQQALFALNDAFIIDQARALTALAREETGATENPRKMIEWLYQRVYLREPSQAEFSLATRFLRDAARNRGRSLRGSWVYGYGSADPEVEARDRFRRLPYFNPKTKRYQPGRVFPHPKLGHVMIHRGGGHPGRGPATAAIRRWFAPRDGELAIEGEIAVGRPRRSDGVRATILSNRGGILGQWLSDDEPVATQVERYSVKAGEVIDFVVDCLETPTADGFRWTPSIRYRVVPEETDGQTQTVWDAKVDYGPPPPPPLQPMQQLAHALLMTNEFLFVD